MKKFLLSLFMVLAISLITKAETYTFDFSSNEKWTATIGSDKSVESGSDNKLNAFYYTETGHCFNAGGTGYFNSGYFLWGKTGAYIELPTFQGEKITNITAHSSTGHSTNVTVNVYDTNGSEASTGIKWSTKDKDYSYDIAEAFQKSVLRLQVTNKYNCQLTTLTITTKSADETVPTLSLSTPSKFVTVLNDTKSQNVIVSANNLTEDIKLTLVDASGRFSIDKTTLNPEGGNVEISYMGVNAGSAEATLKVTCGDLETEKTIEAYSAAHIGSQEDPLTVTDIVELNNALVGTYWVVGIIANGCADSNGLTSTLTNTNIVLEETGQEETVPVQLPVGDIRTALNIVEHSENIGASVKVYGTLGESYFGRAAVKSVSDYVLDENTIGEVKQISFGYVTKVTSGKKYLIVAERWITPDSGDPYISSVMATPLSGNFGYISVEDATQENGYIKLTSYVNAFTITETEGGYTIQDSNGKYLYQTGTYNSFNVSTDLPETGAVWTIEPTNDNTGSMTITNTSVNKWIQYSTGYSSFGSYDSLQANAVLPRLYEESATAEDDVLTGIEDAMIDADAPVEYYNLQGVKVANPENGIFIKRQGGKAIKVVL